MFLLLTLKTPLYILEQISIGKRPKYFEASGFPCCILRNTNFFWNRSRKSKKIHVRKSGYVSKQNGIYRRRLFMMRIINTKLSTSKAIYGEHTFCYRDYVCQVSKLQHMYVIGLILLSVLETTKQTRLYQI